MVFFIFRFTFDSFFIRAISLLIKPFYCFNRIFEKLKINSINTFKSCDYINIFSVALVPLPVFPNVFFASLRIS